MNLSVNEQIFKLIDDSKNILVLIDKNINGDALCSSLAFGLYLKNSGKNICVALENVINLDNKYSFLNGLDLLKEKIENTSKFTIAVNTKTIKAKELSYEPKENSIEIYLSPQGDMNFTKDDVTILDNTKNFDLIITIGLSNISNIGKLYSENIEFFYNKNIINIDINPANERYGQINIIEPHYRSLSEKIFDLLSFGNPDFITKEVATNFLAGIIDKTNGFRLSDISPNTMSTVSNLMDIGANREIIIDSFFRTKTVDQLKVWAKIISKINVESDSNIVWFSLSDFPNTENINLQDFFNDIINTIKNINIAVFFNKKDDIIFAQIFTSNNIDALEITSEFKSIGNKSAAQFAIANSDENKVVEVVLKKIKERI